MLSKGLLVNYRLAKQARQPLNCFDPMEVQSAQRRYEALATKIAGFSRRYWTQSSSGKYDNIMQLRVRANEMLK